MSRWIDFDFVKSKKRFDKGKMKFIVWMQDIYHAPSLDLVRCGECKWADNCSQNVAIRESYQMYEKLNFCSYGERKDNESD